MGALCLNLASLLTGSLRQSITGTTGGASPKNKKEEPAPELTPLEKLLQNAGPIREDGSDKFFGLENVRPKPRCFVTSFDPC